MQAGHFISGFESGFQPVVDPASSTPAAWPSRVARWSCIIGHATGCCVHTACTVRSNERLRGQRPPPTVPSDAPRRPGRRLARNTRCDPRGHGTVPSAPRNRLPWPTSCTARQLTRRQGSRELHLRTPMQHSRPGRRTPWPPQCTLWPASCSWGPARRPPRTAGRLPWLYASHRRINRPS